MCEPRFCMDCRHRRAKRRRPLHDLSGNDERKRTGKKNRKRNADRRKALMPCRAGTAAPPASSSFPACGGGSRRGRTSVGVPPRLLPERLSSQRLSVRPGFLGRGKQRLILDARSGRSGVPRGGNPRSLRNQNRAALAFDLWFASVFHSTLLLA